jgi:alkylation response protein AidB-like acyl-CoA dehydrogenase
MHVCSTLWSGALADDLPMSAEDRTSHEKRRHVHYRRIIEHGAVYAQPFSEGGAAAAGTVAFGTEARPVDGGFIVNGKKIFASLSGAADSTCVLLHRAPKGRPRAAATRLSGQPA